MARSRPKKRVRTASVDHDIISHLPSEIKDKILAKLPIKDAIRTSILSTKWRYAWTSMPHIVLEDEDLVSNDRSSPRSQFVRNVDFILSNHKGSILTFHLSTQYLCPKAFDRWILNLSENGVTELLLMPDLASNFKYKIPSNFFLCDALQFVELWSCSGKLPSGFKGFKLLKTFELTKCTISVADIEGLVSSSPNLEQLVLKIFQAGDDLRTFSKSLECLMVAGDFQDVEIDAPNLTLLLIGHLKYKNPPARVNSINKLYQSLGGLLNIKQITLLGFSVRNLVDGSPAVLQLSCFRNLGTVNMDINFADQKESDFSWSPLQNAINLQDLKLTVRRSSSVKTIRSNFWEKDIVFKLLQMVCIVRFGASEPVLAFVKYIFGSSPNLEKLTLEEHSTYPNEESLLVFKQLLKLRRASTKVEVVFE